MKKILQTGKAEKEQALRFNNFQGLNWEKSAKRPNMAKKLNEILKLIRSLACCVARIRWLPLPSHYLYLRQPTIN